MTLLQEKADEWGLVMIIILDLMKHRRRIEGSNWGCAEGWLQDKTKSELKLPCKDKLRGS
jgi:hypothetical protein